MCLAILPALMRRCYAMAMQSLNYAARQETSHLSARLTALRQASKMLLSSEHPAWLDIQIFHIFL
jgi:hypothetical protein